MNVLQVVMLLLHAIVSVILIALVVSQTSKSEGLGAIGGGSSGPSLRGRAGVDEKLSEYTKYVAIAFLVLSALFYFLAQKFGWR